MKRWSWLAPLLAFVGGFVAVQLWHAHLGFSARDQESHARQLVMDFGERMQLVPLMGAPEVGSAAIREQYGPLADPVLVERWATNPAGAPGRLAPAPYPDRVEVASVSPQGEGAFAVAGDIVEVSGESDIARIPFSATVQKQGKQLRITSFESFREAGQQAR